MKRKMMIAVCCALILCAVSGCQLAVESAGDDASEDRLIGVFVTMEYLDLFDFEGYMNDNFDSLQDGDIVIDERNTQDYQGRLYASLVPRTDIIEETGEEIVTHEYVFEGIEGISHCVPTIQATDVENSYVATMSDPAISDGHTHIDVGDDSNGLALDGTIYVTPSSELRTYYINPVYQCVDGSVYLVSGDGHSTSTDAFGEGVVFSQTLDATSTIVEDGKARTDSVSIKISFSVMFAPEKITVVQMSADDSPISRTEYEPGELPEELVLEAGAEYFIVETHMRGEAGNTKISREIYGRDAEHIETFFARADGVCIKHWTQITAS